jgi:hypothetical protein
MFGLSFALLVSEVGSCCCVELLQCLCILASWALVAQIVFSFVRLGAAGQRSWLAGNGLWQLAQRSKAVQLLPHAPLCWSVVTKQWPHHALLTQ